MPVKINDSTVYLYKAYVPGTICFMLVCQSVYMVTERFPWLHRYNEKL